MDHQHWNPPFASVPQCQSLVGFSTPTGQYSYSLIHLGFHPLTAKTTGNVLCKYLVSRSSSVTALRDKRSFALSNMLAFRPSSAGTPGVNLLATLLKQFRIASRVLRGGRSIARTLYSNTCISPRRCQFTRCPAKMTDIRYSLIVYLSLRTRSILSRIWKRLGSSTSASTLILLQSLNPALTFNGA